MNYDDGFAAFINGSHVVSSPNAPDESTLTYNTLVSSHGPGAYEDFDITAKISSLVNGSNVLAIQGMNTNATSSDAFEKSGDLTTWTSVPDSVVSTTIDAEVRRAVVPIPPGMTTLFLRLKITTP